MVKVSQQDAAGLAGSSDGNIGRGLHGAQEYSKISVYESTPCNSVCLKFPVKIFLQSGW
jgi:hypothetical protein